MRGGGRDAFKANESRMPGDGDDDYDGVDFEKSGRKGGRLRWNRFKWILFVSNLVVSAHIHHLWFSYLVILSRSITLPTVFPSLSLSTGTPGAGYSFGNTSEIPVFLFALAYYFFALPPPSSLRPHRTQLPIPLAVVHVGDGVGRCASPW